MKISLFVFGFSRAFLSARCGFLFCLLFTLAFSTGQRASAPASVFDIYVFSCRRIQDVPQLIIVCEGLFALLAHLLDRTHEEARLFPVLAINADDVVFHSLQTPFIR